MSSIIKKIAITEKSTDLQADGKYVFIVTPSANKQQIKQAVEDEYNVDVVKVNTVNHTSRAKRWRGFAGRKNQNKKAIVTLAEGQSIAVQ